MDKHGVAGAVTQGIINLLEAIEIYMEERNAAVTRRNIRRGKAREDAVEIAPIGQLLQGIVERLTFNPGFGGFQLDISRLGQDISCLPTLRKRHTSAVTSQWAPTNFGVPSTPSK